MTVLLEYIDLLANFHPHPDLSCVEVGLSSAAEEVVDMRGGWADPDLFL